MSNPEIDFLLETEHALQSQLDRIHSRLELLLPLADAALADTIEFEAIKPKHLSLVLFDYPDGAA